MKGIFKKTVGFLLAAAMAFSSFNAFAYTNSICIEDEWGTGSMVYGTGDPFIMKYNGKYYLYVSTMDNQYGFRVWSSDNMADWKFEGNAGVDEDKDITKGAYAPEVTYWNGTFYLYSATPGGAQHRVFTSKSPTGPFKFVTPITNIIDGNLYIDDNEEATRYFFVAGNACLKYTNLTTSMMKTTSGLTDYPALNICSGWTEGPTLFKRRDKYYMTYTGNHVWSDDYRIEYAVGDTAMSLNEPEENLLLVSSTGKSETCGHCKTGL